MRVLNSVANMFGLSKGRRNDILATWRRWTHWQPAFYRKATAYGLNREPREVKITVSVTSYPGRIKIVDRTIDTLLNQTLKPDRVMLWLGEDKFPQKEAQLPKRLLKLREYGLTIGWCRDLRSYTKLLPALKAHPDDIIVTADDDILYNPDMVETLYNSYISAPECIHTQAAMRMEGDGKGGLSSYNDWWYCKTSGEKSYANLLMGVNGVLYPPHSMPKEIFNEAAFKRIAPTTDDLWFWAMAVLNGHRICNLDANGVGRTSSNYDAAGTGSLWSINESVTNGNDKQLDEILKEYPAVRENLMSDIARL